ncbi:polysaccharide biosynthesis protein [Geomonas silvestris]|uniref:Polysaccharide biosynthesis protein n=1 Tax=Geomonas silvestris TaxID=2740184 RepID=A0A6V8MCR2_9BACT|nr:XrtA-associated tyrosine autokinase [Geomonas silvestris]GFO57781.1 polysaccharide biosynthesis protein [Geomonas silvestris]
MSRIEMAMEKAAQLRQTGGEAAPTPAEALQPERPFSAATEDRHELRAPVSPQYGKLEPDNPFLVNLYDPHSPAAEEYRKLKSVLVKMTTGETFRNALMVTSALPNEGKSLTAVNLALSLAQELDHTVLLVDADLRRPSVHHYLNVEQGVGFSEVLSGEVGLGEAIIPTGMGKLSIIRSGRTIDNPSELFTAQRTRAIIQELKTRYPDRYIIFDTPPVLPFAESRSLAHLVDGVLFVIMERLASQVNIREALDSLKGCPVLGTIYNAAAVDRADGRYSYYRDYSRGKQAVAP